VVSRRKRSNSSVGNKLNTLTDKVTGQEKLQQVVGTQTNAVTNDSIALGAVNTESVADRSITSSKIGRGEVTSENLGVINEIIASGGLDIETGVDGHLSLSGGKYEEPYDGIEDSGGYMTVAFDPTDNAIKIIDNAVTAGSFGSATQVGTFTVDAQGRLTAASNTPIAIAQSQVANLTTDLSAKANLTGAAFSGQISVPQNSGVNLNGAGAAGSGSVLGTSTDGAGYSGTNVQIQSWWGIGFGPSIGGQPVAQGTNAVVINARNGDLSAQGTIYASGRNYSPHTPFAMSAGILSLNGNGTRTRSGTVTFPAGRFSVAPMVTVGSELGVLHASTGSPTASGMTITLTHIDNSTWSSTYDVRWIAVQMTSTTAAG
jgi:hypothetical protein